MAITSSDKREMEEIARREMKSFMDAHSPRRAQVQRTIYQGGDF